MKAEKFESLAYLRTLASKKGQNFATRRLIKDVQEIENNDIPTVNVTAAPLDDNLFIWHGNLMGPKDSLYEGSLFHVEMVIPETYPFTAPKITIFGKIHHPNCFGNVLCLDLTDPTINTATGGGWTAAYTIQSVLLQLQSFLNEGSEKYQQEIEKKKKKTKKKTVKKGTGIDSMSQSVINEEVEEEEEEEDENIKLIREASEFNKEWSCSRCPHKGFKSQWPPAKKQNQFNEDEDFKIARTEDSLYEEGINCFYSKSKLSEGVLGVGLKVTVISRNGDINQCQPTTDILSWKSYFKNGVRRAVNGDKFGYWIPFYFRKEDKDRTLDLAKKSIGFICAHSSKRFEPAMAPKVLIKALSSCIIRVVERKIYPSISLIRHIVNFHGLLLLFIREFPELSGVIDKEIEAFIASDDNRTKKNCSNMIVILAYLLVSEKYKWEDVVNSYNEEQLDRQVLWILKKIPELEDDSGTFVIEENRVRITFKSQIMGYFITCFFHDYIKIAKGEFKTWNGLLETLEGNCCRLSSKTENELQQKFFNLSEKVTSYEEYYSYIGAGSKTFEEICGRLKHAVANSKRKRYHGGADEIIDIPPVEEQVKSYEASREDLSNLIEGGKLKSFTEEQWKGKCLKRWGWISKFAAHDIDDNVKPSHIAEAIDQLDFSWNVIFEDHIEPSSKIQERFKINKPTRHRPEIVKTYLDNFNWRDLFIKLDLEEATRLLNYSSDFKSYYERVDVAVEHLSTLVLYVSNCTNLKSGQFYLCGILKKFKNLRCLKIKMSCITTIPYKAVNNIKKGLVSAIKNGSKIEHLEIIKSSFDLEHKSQE